MNDIVKKFAQNWMKDRKITDMHTQQLIIEFAHEIDKMLVESLVVKGSNEKN